MDNKIIGKVTATEREPTNCNELSFWIHKDVVLKPFDIVKVHNISKINESSYTYAIVQDLEYYTDSANHLSNYISSDFGDINAKPLNERLGMTIVRANVLYNTQEIEMPVRDGEIVEWADAEGIKEALGLSNYQEPIPAGYIWMSNGEEVPIELEAQYLLGPEGAHLNIAGISGLATKTSYIMFVLNSIQQRLSKDVCIIIFNVKGNDLLSIDEPNEELDDYKKEEWKKCGLIPKPFQSVEYLYPYADRSNNHYSISHVDENILEKQIFKNCAFNYYYDVEIGKEKLPLIFSDIDDPNATMESCAKESFSIDSSSWGGFKEELKSKTQKGISKNPEISVLSWRKFYRLFTSRTENDIFSEKAVVQVKERRQKKIKDAILELKPGKVLVIDVEPLPDYLQCLVFGDVIQTIYSAKLGDYEEIDPKKLGKVVIFADELNKYAPKFGDNKRTLTQNILEITERGRSLGVVLFGAEQFRSGVHDRVLGNCSTNIYGRTSPLEISKCPDYKYFPKAYSAVLTRLPKGSLLLQHAVFKTSLIKVKFPYPSYYQPKIK